MRKKSVVSLGASVVLAFAGCGPGQRIEAGKAASGSNAADVQAILQLEENVFEAEIAGDIDAWASFFAEDVNLMPPDVPMLVGSEAIQAWAAPFFEQFDLHEETDWREVEVSGDWGCIRAHWTWTLTPKGGGDSVTDTGKSIWIVSRQDDGSWKIACAIWNSDHPGADEDY